MTDLRRIEIHALLTRYRDRCREFGAASHLARTTAELLGETVGEIWDAWEAAEIENAQLREELEIAQDRNRCRAALISQLRDALDSARQDAPEPAGGLSDPGEAIPSPEVKS
jgi:hypothetical protein